MMIEEIDIKKYINLYSSNIKSRIHSLDDYINLILILWNASFDSGFETYCIRQGIFTENEISNLPNELNLLFKEALLEFPNNKELQFWKIYLNDLGAYSECSHKSDIEDLLKEMDFDLPYFYMYVQCNIFNKNHLEKLKFNLTNEKESYKKYYMLSYLNSI